MGTDTPDISLLLGCACFNTRMAARAVTQHYDRKLAPSGLKVTQLATMAMIKNAGALSMHALAQVLKLDPSTLTRTLQPLETEGLLRIEEGEDRRRREVVLTAAGHRAVEKAYRLWREAQDDARQALGEKRFDRLIGDLSALTTALSERK